MRDRPLIHDLAGSVPQPCNFTAHPPSKFPCQCEILPSTRKRKRGTADLEASSPPKKNRSSPKERRPNSGQNASFWDSLSKIWLTRRALQELDRRNFQNPAESSLISPTSHRQKRKKKVKQYTQKNLSGLKRLARHGGPDLSDIKGHSKYSEVSTAAMPKRRFKSTKSETKFGSSKRTASGKTTTSGSSKNSSPYTGNFAQNLSDNFISRPDPFEKPTNFGEINERLQRRRSSLSPSRGSDDGFDLFTQSIYRVVNEDDVNCEIKPKIIGNTRYAAMSNLQFNNLVPLTDTNLTDPKPDYYQGARPAPRDRRLREELHHFVVPANNKEAPFLPNFFMELKAPGGSPEVALRQARYDGAVGARGIQQVQSLSKSLEGSEVYDGNAYTSSVVYCGTGDLKLYTHHPTQPGGPGTAPHYHMTPLRSYSLADSRQSYREGLTAFRNLGDIADEHRERLIQDANSRWNDSAREGQVLKPSHPGAPQVPNVPQIDGIPSVVACENDEDEDDDDQDSESILPTAKKPKRLAHLEEGIPERECILSL